MMDPMDTIIDEYVSADESGRLHLFLAHRDLRDSFIKIDLSESSQVRKASSVQSGKRWVERIFQYCPVCSK
jgi:hypothetical protein